MEILRKAFVSLKNDEAFIEEHTRIIGVRPELVDPEEGSRLLQMLPKASDEAKAAVKAAIARK